MDGSAILAYSLIIAVALAIRAWAGMLDRERIREHVEGNGGKVQSIESTWSLFGTGWRATRNARLYQVRYTTHRGRTVTATCATNMFSGVWWPRETPPGLSDAREALPGAPDVSPEEMRQSHATPAEPIACLACGAKIPARQTHCPHCGWSYQGQ